jgi:hypothetical protein
VIDEGDAVAARSHPGVPDPASRFVEHLADRILEPSAAPDRSNDGRILSVPAPVGELHVFEHLPGRPSADGAHARERSLVDEFAHDPAAERDGGIAGG